MVTEFRLNYTAEQVNSKIGEIENLAKRDELPTKLSELANDSGFATESYVDTAVNNIDIYDTIEINSNTAGKNLQNDGEEIYWMPEGSVRAKGDRVSIEPSQGNNISVITQITNTVANDAGYFPQTKLYLNQFTGTNLFNLYNDDNWDAPPDSGGINQKLFPGLIREKDGITIIYNEDNTVTLSGTATADVLAVNLKWYPGTNQYFFMLPAGTYCIPNGVKMNMRSLAASKNHQVSGRDGPFTLAEPHYISQYFINVSAGDVINNKVIPLGVYVGSSIPTDTRYYGNFYSVTLSQKPALNSKFNWLTGELTAEDGTLIEQIGSTFITAMDGTNTIISGFGKNIISYVKETKILPEISEATAGMFLTNDGVSTYWSSPGAKTISGEMVSFRPANEDLKVISKINRSTDTYTKRLNEIQLRHFTGNNVLDFAKIAGLNEKGSSISSYGLTITSNGNGTATITGSSTSTESWTSLFKQAFYPEVQGHTIYVFPAGTYVTHDNCRFNWRYIDGSNAGFGVRGIVEFVKPFYIMEISITIATNSILPADGITIPLGIYKGNILPTSDFAYNGITYTATFSTDVTEGEYNWNTGVLKDAYGNVIEELPKTTFTCYEGINTVFTGVGENEITYQSGVAGNSDGAIVNVSTFNPEDYSLPILYLEGDISSMSKDTKVSLIYKYLDKKGTCTCKWQGSSSLAYEKKNYTIVFDTPFEAASGWGSHSKYCIKANYIDFSHVRNICSAKLWGEARKTIGGDVFQNLVNAGAIDGFPIVVVINNEYKGLYSFNIPKDAWMFGYSGDVATEAIVSAEIGTDATMFKAPAVMDGSDFEFEHIADSADEAALKASFGELYNKVTNYSATDMYNSELSQILDMDRLLDYYVFVVMFDAVDCYKKNYLMTTKDGVKWHIGAYDLDTTFGNQWQGVSYYKPTWRNFAWYASESALFNVIYTHHKNELKARYNLRKYDKWSEENLFITLYNYAVQIPKIYFDEELKLWKSLPGTNTNNVSEILDFHRMKIKHLDNEIKNWG